MTSKTVSDIVRLGPVIPVLAFDSAEQGENVSRALHAGGVKVLEITLRTAAGLEAMVLSLAAAKPEAAVASLDKLNRLRRATEVPSRTKGA